MLAGRPTDFNGTRLDASLETFLTKKRKNKGRGAHWALELRYVTLQRPYGNSHRTPFILSGKVLVVLDMNHEAAYGLLDPL